MKALIYGNTVKHVIFYQVMQMLRSTKVLQNIFSHFRTEIAFNILPRIFI